MPLISARDIKGLWGLLLCCIGLASCEQKEPQCYEPTLVRAANSFVVRDTYRVFYYTLPDSIYSDSLSTRYRDSAMLFSEMKILNETLNNYTIVGTEQGSNVMRVAFNPLKDSTRYAFRADTASSVWDTITYFYNPTVHFVSNNCGYNYYYHINKVQFTHNLLDSMGLQQTDVTNNVSDKHVQLYFKKKF